MDKKSKIFAIAVSGSPGSGKAKLCKLLQEELPEGSSCILSSKWYFKDNGATPGYNSESLNFNVQETIPLKNFISDIESLKTGHSISTPTEQKVLIEPVQFIIIEGCFLLAAPEYRNLFDLKIFLSASNEHCIEVITDREMSTFGKTPEQIKHTFDSGILPLIENYIQPSAAYADLSIDITQNAAPFVKAIVNRIQKLASPKKLETQHLELIEELETRYANGAMLARQYQFKKFAWLFIVNGSKFIKRMIDILSAGLAITLFSPMFILIMLAIKLTDGGPIFYISTRVGKWGREFDFPKFRSMIINADKVKDELLQDNEHGSEGVTFKMKNDPRITWIGRFLRRTSLDESPQLWSVLVGDMTLVGPRPPVPREVALYTISDRRRLDITPGITCIWQVTGRSDIPFPEQVELDVKYINSQSVWQDIKLLFMTIPAVLLGKGAY